MTVSIARMTVMGMFNFLMEASVLTKAVVVRRPERSWSKIVWQNADTMPMYDIVHIFRHIALLLYFNETLYSSLLAYMLAAVQLKHHEIMVYASIVKCYKSNAQDNQ